MKAHLLSPHRRASHVLIPMPSGNVARIPIEPQYEDETFDLEEAKLFEDTARHKGHTNILDMLADLRGQGLSRQQAVATVCQYMDALRQDEEDKANGR